MTQWAAKGMSVLPGLKPRPQHHIVSKKNLNETIESSSNILFVYLKDIKDSEFQVNGKVGKITLEDCGNTIVTISDPVVGGVVEIIRCKNITFKLVNNAEIPTLQVDDSHDISVCIKSKPQLECIFFIRTQAIKLFLEEQTAEEENGLTLEFNIPTPDEKLQYQQIAHWSTASADSTFITEIHNSYEKDVTAQMKKAVEE